MISISTGLKIAFSVAGTLIGAGFATGKELALFFPGDGFDSVFLLCCSLTFMSLVSVFYFEQQKSGKSVHSCTKWISPVLSAFSGACYTVMLACGGEAISSIAPLSFIAGVLITYALTLFILRIGINGLYLFNSIATPILITGMLIFSLIGLTIPVGCFTKTFSPVGTALVYTGYNLLSVLPFLGAIAKDSDIKHGKQGIAGGFFLVALSGILLKCVLNRFHSIAYESSLPIVKIIEMVSPLLSGVYSILLYLAVLTTAVSCLYAVSGGKHLIRISIFLLICSFFGFSVLLEKLYTGFGYLGILIIPVVLWNYIKRKDES